MVNQILDLVTLPASNYCDESNKNQLEQSTILVPASELHEGQQVLHNGTLLKVRRVVPAFTRSQACHIHLVPPNWQPLVGVNQQLADRDEAAVLIRVACPTRKPFQVVA
jgi:hypothetical protein